MKKTSLVALCALALATLLTAMPALAENPSDLSVTAECGTGPTLQQYDMPRDESGKINLVNSILAMDGRSPGYSESDLQPVGAIICLKEGTPDIYLLDVGFGPNLQFPSKEMLIEFIVTMQHEADAAAVRGYEDGLKAQGNS